MANLPWTHNFVLIEKVKDTEKRNWYAIKCLENGWSKTVLEHQIELELYERQADSSKKLKFQDIEIVYNLIGAIDLPQYAI